jgi:N-acetylneuraminate synthase/N,N'-diacetyllegionaminate synthase
MRSIELAKECGADAVKFQHFTAKEMWGDGKQTMTPETWLHPLKKCAEENNIEFSCTFFDPLKLSNYLDILDFIKIASSNMMDIRLLEIAKSAPQEVLVSTGGHHLSEVQRVFSYMPAAQFLYCESVYPSYVNNKRKLQNVYFAGVSDHSLDVYPDFDGYDYVEKHVNLVDTKGTPDAGHALNAEQFVKYCTHLKYDTSPSLLSDEELDMRLLHNVRMVAKRDIPAGDRFTWNNLDVKRGIKKCENYINPMDSGLILGKTATRAIRKWEPIASTDVHTPQRKAEYLHT